MIELCGFCSWIAILCLLFCLLIFPGRWIYHLRKVRLWNQRKEEAYSQQKQYVAESQKEVGEEIKVVQTKDMDLHKDFYFKLHHLEDYPEILSPARDLLITFFSQGLAHAVNRGKVGILAIEYYTPGNLAKFMQDESDHISKQWIQYLSRRKSGGPREMIKDKAHGILWLREIAPLKYVDGAWLGHVNKVSTPFALRHVSKDAWQVLSEELGDGDLQKNHVYIYHQLIKQIAPELPDGDDIDFIHPRHNLNEPRVWKAALAQLLISLFPHNFLPEILGYNLHFEGLTIETMTAAKELAEVQLDPLYFLLHISIDNADSGHTAMAGEAVRGYMHHILTTQGHSAAQLAWKRIQSGYILSESLSESPDESQSSEATSFLKEDFPRTSQELEVIKIFAAKSAVSHKIHCSSRVRIGPRILYDWLDPIAFSRKEWQREFLNALADAKPWVVKGDSSRSKLIKALLWKGKMFGSFTQTEVEITARWIDSLATRSDPKFYWQFIGCDAIPSAQALANLDILVDYPVFQNEGFNFNKLHYEGLQTLDSAALNKPLNLAGEANLNRFLPLWFSHPCLLESFVCIPWRTTNKKACAVVRILRAQSSFSAEGPGVSGMDEVRRTSRVGLIELGLEIMDRAGLSKPSCLRDVLIGRENEFSRFMLDLSMHPKKNMAMLLGLAWAFAGLHDAIASSNLLSVESREIISNIAGREKENLSICLEELKKEDKYIEFCGGFLLGKREIELCF